MNLANEKGSQAAVSGTFGSSKARRPESSTPGKLKARNQKQQQLENEEYEEEFEQLLDADDEDGEEHTARDQNNALGPSEHVGGDMA